VKILVVGATGFVGKTLLPLLAEKGHKIIALTRDIKAAQVRLPVTCKIIEWEKDFLKNEEGIEVVINLCGENVASGFWTKKKKQIIYDSRVLSTRNLIEFFQKNTHPIKTWISASAIGIYKNSIVPNESSPSGKGFLAKVCKDWEEATFKVKDLNIRAVVFRIGMVLGFDGGAMGKILPLFKLGLGGNIGDGNQWMSWIHVRDLAGLIVEAIDNTSYEGPINAVGPNPVTNRDFTITLANLLRRPAILPVPVWLLKNILGEMSQILTTSQKVSSELVKKLNYKFIYPKIRGALKNIGDQTGHTLLIEQWVPQPLDKIFRFFIDPHNLETLTPEILKFKILKVTSAPIKEGTLLDYSLKIRGIPVRWQSKITECIHEIRFADMQTRGPYQFWHHTHEFREKDGGTIIRDRVFYKLPGWVPGDIIAHWFVRKELERIFLHRRKVVAELFHAGK